MKGKILIADDEPRIRRIIALLLQEEGYDVLTVGNGSEAVVEASRFNPDIILMDQQMPGMNGIEALEKIRSTRPGQVILLITAFGSISLAVDAVKKGAYDFIEKPFDNDALLLKVNRAIEHCHLKGEIHQLKAQLGEPERPIIGSKGGLRIIMEQVARVANTEATVLIHGESGTGKELIARDIHARSPRKGKPFVAINCGAIPLPLIENELFGHEKGAFTDAKEAQPGIFEQAEGGTLFLDEIGELPIDAQVKLLRVLEERNITRIGGTKLIPVNVRIIAATNRNLEEEVQNNKFRLDLLYRLNVFTLELPPLRERKEDIPLLTDFFIRKYNKVLNLSIRTITPAAMDKLCNYDWPGNIRDLENAIQSAMILCLNETIDTAQLPGRIKGFEQEESITIGKTEANGIKEANAQVEKKVIQETLKKYNNNRTLTAEALNISRKTLFNKMKKYGLGD
ncbi:sigma-54-dependent transcriptional regulator [Bacteroides sp.]